MIVKRMQILGVPITLRYPTGADVEIKKFNAINDTELALYVGGELLMVISSYLHIRPEEPNYLGIGTAGRRGKIMVDGRHYYKADQPYYDRNTIITPGTVITVTSGNPKDSWLIRVSHPWYYFWQKRAWLKFNGSPRKLRRRKKKRR